MNLWKNNQGSYTLEATVAVPVFLAILLFLINIINVAMVYIAMDHAVSETVKLVAAYSYPLTKVSSTPGGSNPGASPDSKAGNDTADTTEGDITDDKTARDKITGDKTAGNDIAGQLIASLKEKGSSILLDLAVKEIIKKKISDFYPLGSIDNHSFVLSQVKMINLSGEDSRIREVNGIKLNPEDIAIVAVYTVKLPVPFMPMREITLSNTAVERAWTDG